VLKFGWDVLGELAQLGVMFYEGLIFAHSFWICTVLLAINYIINPLRIRRLLANALFSSYKIMNDKINQSYARNPPPTQHVPKPH